MIIADLAVEHALILTIDEHHTIFSDGLMLINGDKIVYVGPSLTKTQYTANKTINAEGNILMPPFINAHCHAGMSIFRGLGNETNLKTWLQEFVWPAEAKYTTAENVYLGSLASGIEMIKSGTSTFADMYFFQDQVAKAVKKLGMRCILGEGILDFPTPNKKTVADGLRFTEELFTDQVNDPLTGISLPAHAPYTCCADTLIRIRKLADRLNIPVSIHLAETSEEIQNSIKEHGKTSTAYLDDLGFFNGPCIAYHCIHLNDNDIQILKSHSVKLITVPNSNHMLASGICNVSGLLAEGFEVGIGTDGAASNNNQCVLLDMQQMIRTQKVNQKNSDSITARQAVTMATRYGAGAYGLSNKLGSLSKGMLADFILINTNQAHMQPLYDPYAQIVYSMQVDDVSDLFVAGKCIMENRTIIGVDEKIVRERLLALRKQMDI